MLKLFILLMVSFLVLMSPYRLFVLIMSLLSYNADFSPEGWHLFYIQLTQWVTTIVFASNSIVNPILFNFLSSRFRYAFFSLFFPPLINIIHLLEPQLSWTCQKPATQKCYVTRVRNPRETAFGVYEILTISERIVLDR